MRFYFENIDVEMAKKFDPSAHELVDIGIDSILSVILVIRLIRAHHPKSLVFLKRKFGVKEQCFQCECYSKWPWLHYN